MSKSTHEWPRMTTNDHEWPRVDHEWDCIKIFGWCHDDVIITSFYQIITISRQTGRFLRPSGFDIFAISDWMGGARGRTGRGHGGGTKFPPPAPFNLGSGHYPESQILSTSIPTTPPSKATSNQGWKKKRESENDKQKLTKRFSVKVRDLRKYLIVKRL